MSTYAIPDHLKLAAIDAAGEAEFEAITEHEREGHPMRLIFFQPMPPGELEVLKTSGVGDGFPVVDVHNFPNWDPASYPAFMFEGQELTALVAVMGLDGSFQPYLREEVTADVQSTYLECIKAILDTA